jgi:hypothetical protein
MDPLSLIFAKVSLALFGISAYLELPGVLFASALVVAILSLALIHKHR